MNPLPPTNPEVPSVDALGADRASRRRVNNGRRLVWFAWLLIVLSLAFFKPLLAWGGFALHSNTNSHVLLVPFISAYLIWLQRKNPLPPLVAAPALAVIPLVLGVVTLKAFLFTATASLGSALNDRLALATFSYLCFIWAGGLLLLGGRVLWQFLLPAAFLVFLVPLPTILENGIEHFFQYASAEAAALLFGVSGSAFYRDGLLFQLPGISIRVAQECSGIRSSLVLFITSLVAGHLFLRSPWRRTVLTLFVIPLAILRNGFRIFTIAMLCVHVDPSMIDSQIHKNGGPLFFVLSLIPFFLLLLWLRRQERHGVSVATSESKPRS